MTLRHPAGHLGARDAHPPTMVLAIGGNSLVKAGEPSTIATQRAHVAETCRAIVDAVADGWRVVLTHGNGPQVGAELLRSERAAREAYTLPLDVCVAATQGEIGFLLEQGVRDALAARRIDRLVATVLAQVVVDRADPAFSHPTKPIGPYYSEPEAEYRTSLGWSLVDVPPHGFRRVVASPDPREIVEERVIRRLVEHDVIVITLGGGGIPVVHHGLRLAGVEAVIDKDLASALLAVRLHADLFVMTTEVDRIYLGYGRPGARPLDVVDARDLRRHAAGGEFPPGSMGPKVEAALRFVESGGAEAIVTSYDRLNLARHGLAGTHVRNKDDHYGLHRTRELARRA